MQEITVIHTEEVSAPRVISPLNHMKTQLQHLMMVTGQLKDALEAEPAKIWQLNKQTEAINLAAMHVTRAAMRLELDILRNA